MVDRLARDLETLRGATVSGGGLSPLAEASRLEREFAHLSQEIQKLLNDPRLTPAFRTAFTDETVPATWQRDDLGVITAENAGDAINALPGAVGLLRGVHRELSEHLASLPATVVGTGLLRSQAARQFVDQRPEALEGMAPDDAVAALAAVLDEAAGERGESQFRALRNGLVDRGLQLLPPATVDRAHTAVLPGIDAGQLPSAFTVDDAVTGRAGPGDGTAADPLFVVRQPQARDLSGLSGQEPGAVMFAPGTRFEVVEDSVRDGRRIVELRHPRAASDSDAESVDIPVGLGSPVDSAAPAPVQSSSAASRSQDSGPDAQAPAVVSTPSGFYLRAQGAGDMQDAPEDLVAALAFPPVAGALVVHVHFDPESWNLAVGGRMLDVSGFNSRVLPQLALAPGQLLVLVACRIGAVRRSAALAAAGALAEIAQHPVLAATGDVFSTPAGVVEVREPAVGADGRPVLAGQPAVWRLFLPGRVSDPVEFVTTNLATVLQNRALADELPQQTPPLQVGQHPQPPRLPAREIKWLMAPSQGRLADESLPEHQPPVNAPAPGPVSASRSQGIRWNSPAIAGRPGMTGVRFEEQWAPYAAQWSDVLDRLAGDAPAPNLDKQPAGFPRDRAEAFSLYRGARAEHDAAADRLAKMQTHNSLSSSAQAQPVQGSAQSAARRLNQVRGWLATWGITDADAASRAAAEFSQARASGLAAGAPKRSRANRDDNHASDALRAGPVVTRWQTRVRAGGDPQSLTGMLEQAGIAARLSETSVRLQLWVGELVREQLLWMRTVGSYSDADAGRWLGVGHTSVGRMRKEAGIQRRHVDPVDPVLLGVVADWQAELDAEGDASPLVDLLEDAGLTIREERADTLLPGAAGVLLDELAWLMERGSYTHDRLAGWLGVDRAMVSVWLAQEGLRRQEVTADDPVVQAVLVRWRTEVATGRPPALTTLLNEAGVPSHETDSRVLRPGVADLLREQISWLMTRGGARPSNRLLTEWLGVGASAISGWLNELGGWIDSQLMQGVVDQWRAEVQAGGQPGLSLRDLLEAAGITTRSSNVSGLAPPEVARVLREQGIWLMADRGVTNDSRVATMVGVQSQTVGTWWAAAGIEPGGGPAGDLAREVADRWQAEVRAGRRPGRLTDLLREAGITTHYGNVMARGVSEVVRAQFDFLASQGNLVNTDVARMLGVSDASVTGWRKEASAQGSGGASGTGPIGQVVERWREQVTAGRRPSLEDSLEQAGIRLKAGKRYTQDVSAALREQLGWLTGRGIRAEGELLSLLGIERWTLARWLKAPAAGQAKATAGTDTAGKDTAGKGKGAAGKGKGAVRKETAGKGAAGKRAARKETAGKDAAGKGKAQRKPARKRRAAPPASVASDSELTSLSGSSSGSEFGGPSGPSAPMPRGRGRRQPRAGLPVPTAMSGLEWVAAWETSVRGLGRGQAVTSLREFLRQQDVSVSRTVSRYAFMPEWWEIFRDSALRLWGALGGVDPRTGANFTLEDFARLYGATPTAVLAWLGLPDALVSGQPATGHRTALGQVAWRPRRDLRPGPDAMDVDEDAMDVDEQALPSGGSGAGFSPHAPGWARSGRPFFQLPEPDRVREQAELRISAREVRAQLERTADRNDLTAWEVRNLAGGPAATTDGEYEPDGVGFLVTVPVPVPYQPDQAVPNQRLSRVYDREYRSPVELVTMYVQAAGPNHRSRLRMVIALNFFNDPRRDRVPWEGELPYGTTERLERELAEVVAHWQREVDEVAPGIATVIGQMVEPSVWDGDRLVDPDVLRDLMTEGAVSYWRRFPYAGARQAILASDAALARLRELWRLNDEVWIHIGDSDVVDTTNPAGGNSISLLQRYAQEIRSSRSGQEPSTLVRLGGGYAFSPQELQHGPRRGPAPGEPEQLDDATRLTLMLVEGDNLQRGLLSEGRWPRGYFSEQNTMFNSAYLEQFISAMSQQMARALRMPDLSVGVHARLGRLDLLSDEYSRFLADPAARVLTSAHGRRTTITAYDLRAVLRPRTGADGRITGFEVLRPGLTLREFGILATHGIVRKDRNMTFRPTQFLRVGGALALSPEGALFDPERRPGELADRLRRLQGVPHRAAADRLRAQLLDTGPKAAAAAQLAARFERIVAQQWTEPLDHLLAALSDYVREPLPAWYADEFNRLAEIDPADSDLAEVLSRLALGEAPALDDIGAVLQQFRLLSISSGADAQIPSPGPAAPIPGGPSSRPAEEAPTGPRGQQGEAPPRGTRPAAAWSREERAILEDNPWLTAAPEPVRRVQVANLVARRRYEAQAAAASAGYLAYRERLAGDPERRLDVLYDGDCFFNSLRLTVGNYLQGIGNDFGWQGREPSVRQMRDTIAQALEQSYAAYWANPTNATAQGAGLYASLFPGLTGPQAGEPAERDALLAEYAKWIRKPGNWVRDADAETDIGDWMVNIAADLWRLPLTVLGTDYPVDIGPASGGVERLYMLYDGSHYMGVARHAGDPARSALQVLSRPSRPDFVIGEGISRADLARDFDIAFGRLHGAAAAVLRGVSQTDRDRLQRNLDSLVRDFRQAHANAEAADAAANQAALAEAIVRMSGLYQNLANQLREARAGKQAAGAMSGPSGGSSRPAKRGRDGDEGEEGQQAKRGRQHRPQDTAGAAVAVTETGEDNDFEYEVEVVVPFAASAAADVTSHDFALAVGALAADLYGNQPTPVPLTEVIDYLVDEGWAENQHWAGAAPTVDELRVLVSTLSGERADAVGLPEVRAALVELAGVVAGQSQAGPAGPRLPGGFNSGPRLRQRGVRWNLPAQGSPSASGHSEAGEQADAAGLGEFDADWLDKVWGKLPNDPERTDEVDRAVARARQLIGRAGPVTQVRTADPVSELDPLAQAVRWLALEIYRNPGDQAGAEALAGQLAARLDRVLPAQRPGRRPGGGADFSQPAGSAAQAQEQAAGSTSGAQPRQRGVAWNFSLAARRSAPAVPAPVSPAATLSRAARASAAELLRQFDGLARPAGNEASELRSRAITVFGGHHSLSGGQLTTVMSLADRLAPGGRATVAWFDEVGRAVGLHAEGVESNSASRRQVSGLLELAAGVFGDDVPGLMDLQLLADLARTTGAGERPVTVADLAGLFRQLHGRPADADVTPPELRDLVALTAEARALLAAGEPVTSAYLAGVLRQRAAQAAAFADLPANAVAVNAAGIYMTVPGGIGAVERMGHPEFFDASGEQIGYILVSKIRSNADEVSFGVIGKQVELPRVSSLVMWYLAAHSGARRFTVYDIVSDGLPRILGRLGMTSAHPSGLDMSGDVQVVARNAAAAAVAEGWVLRVPGPEAPAGPAEVAGNDAAFANLPPDAVAVHADGTYLTVPSGIGVIDGMDGPRLFSADGKPRGRLRMEGVGEDAGELVLAGVVGNLELSDLLSWYLAAHSAAPRFTVTEVDSRLFSGKLAGVGLTWSGPEEMTGDTRKVARYAAAAATRAGWTLRTPSPLGRLTWAP
jgi:hypothetical protein